MPSAICLVVRRGSLTDRLNTVLYEVGLQLLLHGKSSMRFRLPDCDRIVHTEFKNVNISAMSGIKFVSELASEGQSGTIEAHFLLESRDIAEEDLQRIAAARERGSLDWAEGSGFSDADAEEIVRAAPRAIAA